ncbi:AAA family ATPase [Agromyces subbeticus]|uniref:AAA family ATPase n=1 Tax=Agromyces subbeticus TaxID=293890 RepID=UPI0012EB977D|nr:P-loop NTPase [Agromyces subbeticus]
MTPYLLVSRSAEYEQRLRTLLGRRLHVVTGEFLTFGTDTILDMAGERPRIALLGPVLNYEETRDLVEGLAERHPGIGIIVVREQRSDLEDWVDELELHAVLSPQAADTTTLDLLARLSDWLVANGRAERGDFAVPEEPEPDVPEVGGTIGSVEDLLSFEELVAEPGALDEAGADEASLSMAPDPSDDVQAPVWEFPPMPPGTRSEVIAVVAPKGGQGKSTLAINIAASLAEGAPNSVVLIDADLQFGDVSTSLALEPTATIVDAVAPEASDEIVLKTTLTHHADGFFVVASAPSPELGDGIAPRALARLVERLRGTFRYVVVDTTPGLGEHTLTIIEHATDAVFVTNMAVASLRAMRTEFELLRTLGLTPANRHLVVNFSDRMSGLTVKDVENVIGAPVDVEVPRSPAVLLAVNRGVVLVRSDARDPAAKAIRRLAARIAPDAVTGRTRTDKRRRSHEPV